MDVEALGQMRVAPQCLFPAIAGNPQSMGQSDIVERISAGSGNRAGHIGNAIMHHIIDHIDRLCMGGGLGGFKAAALINRHIDQHGPLLHRAKHIARDELGCSSARYQHRPDDEISLCDHFFKVGLV